MKSCLSVGLFYNCQEVRIGLLCKSGHVVVGVNLFASGTFVSASFQYPAPCVSQSRSFAIKVFNLELGNQQ